MPVKDGIIEFWYDNDHAIYELVIQVKKDKIVSKYISTSEIVWQLHTIPFRHFGSGGAPKDGLLKCVYAQTEIEKMGDKLIEFLDGIPYEYTFYINLPFNLPEQINSLEIGNNITIVRLTEQERQDLGLKENVGLASIFNSSPCASPYPEGAHFKISTSGFGEAAQAQALSTFKRFAYLCRASGFISSIKWDRQAGFGTGGLLAICPKLDQPQVFTLPFDLGKYVSGLKLNEQEFSVYQPPGQPPLTSILGTGNEDYETFYRRKFLFACRTFTKLEALRDHADSEHIISSIEWGFDGCANLNETMGFIQVCIGLEALLGDKSRGGQKSLTEKLADRCAYLLGATPSERKEHAENFISIYDLRSELIHGVCPKISEHHGAKATSADILLSKLIFKEIWLMPAGNN